MSRYVRVGVALALLVASAWSVLPMSVAAASPITVNVRIEGSVDTLFEGPVNAEAILPTPGLSTPSSGGGHPCDVRDNGANEGFGVAAATPTTALAAAAAAAGLSFDATWSGSFGDFFVTQVGPDLEGGPPEFASWGYAVSYTTAGVGGCQFQLAPGSEVLWAYNYFNLHHLLSLTGPSVATVGKPFTVRVTDGSTGDPMAGAQVVEMVGTAAMPVPGATTDASGNATVTVARGGVLTLKAQRADSVRSNALPLCAHSALDGACGVPVPVGVASGPAVSPTSGVATPRIVGIGTGRVFKHGKGPRLLAGAVVTNGGTLRRVRISLERVAGRRCFVFSGTRGRFVRRRCGSSVFFSVGASQSFSYLLPTRLTAGRYVYEIQAEDANGQVSKSVTGVSRVVFRVK
ncbi:MAG: hypothetical protein JWM60_1674 [Solirubrobacterales bacterium]|nr:hypothetical protein [Solirubrobacterales bacterium]